MLQYFSGVASGSYIYSVEFQPTQISGKNVTYFGMNQ